MFIFGGQIRVCLTLSKNKKKTKKKKQKKKKKKKKTTKKNKKTTTKNNMQTYYCIKIIKDLIKPSLEFSFFFCMFFVSKGNLLDFYFFYLKETFFKS